MHANKREEIASVGAGQIVAVMGLKDTKTGHTLCDPQNQVVLESMTFPAPVIEVAIEPKTKSDQEKLGTAIQRLSDEDPTFTVKADEETGQTIIAGMGELHLEILVDRMKREFRVEATVGKPQVAYRETVRNTGREALLHPQEADRWVGSVRQGRHQPRSEHRPRDRPGRGLRVRQQRLRWPRAEGVHPLGRPGRPGGHGVRRARRLPHGRREVLPRGRRLPRRRLVRARVQDRRQPGLQGGRPQGQAGPARADVRRRGDHPRDASSARSSATSTRAAARSRRRRSVTATWSSTRLCLCPRCSGTLAT